MPPEKCTHYHWTCFYERLSPNKGPSMFQAYCMRCRTMSGFCFTMFDAERSMPLGTLSTSIELPATEAIEIFTK